MVLKMQKKTEIHEDFLDRLAKGWVYSDLFYFFFSLQPVFLCPGSPRYWVSPIKGSPLLIFNSLTVLKRLYQMIGQYGERGASGLCSQPPHGRCDLPFDLCVFVQPFHYLYVPEKFFSFQPGSEIKIPAVCAFRV